MFSIVFFLFMDMGTSGELIFSILKGRPKGWKWGGGLIRGWKFPKDILLLVGLEFISVVSDTNVMTGMTYDWNYFNLGRCVEIVGCGPLIFPLDTLFPSFFYT